MKDLEEGHDCLWCGMGLVSVFSETVSSVGSTVGAYWIDHRVWVCLASLRRDSNLTAVILRGIFGMEDMPPKSGDMAGFLPN